VCFGSVVCVLSRQHRYRQQQPQRDLHKASFY
jgi:hypothetical protein